MNRRLALFAALPLLLLSAGCVNYRLGSMLPGDVRTVYIPTCINKTTEPLIEQDVTQAILSQTQMDGSLRIADAETADTILEITLIRFWLDPVSYVAGESSTANQYRLSIRASFVLYRRADRFVVAESPGLTGWYDFDFAGDMTSSKAIALGPAADDLGRRIINNIVQYWPPAPP